jgi:hypothetical protein
MNLSKVLLKYVCVFYFINPNVVDAEVNSESVFSDQIQYELYYDYVYQLNFTEFLLSDCIGDRSIAAKYYLGISLTKEYQEILIGVDNLVDVFTAQTLQDRLWGELVRGVTRGDYATEPGDPIAFSQQVAHEYFDQYEEERDFLCDYIWWQEFTELGLIAEELINDARIRYAADQKLTKFLEITAPSQRNYMRILDNSPLTTEHRRGALPVPTPTEQ